MLQDPDDTSQFLRLDFNRVKGFTPEILKNYSFNFLELESFISRVCDIKHPIVLNLIKLNKKRYNKDMRMHFSSLLSLKNDSFSLKQVFQAFPNGEKS